MRMKSKTQIYQILPAVMCQDSAVVVRLQKQHSMLTWLWGLLQYIIVTFN